MRKLMLLALALLAAGGLYGATVAEAAGCGCGGGCRDKCAKSCGCKATCGACDKCTHACTCLPRFCPDPGIGGFHTDCVDGCCPPSGGTVEVCADTWDLGKKWCDGQCHHPYEQVFNGHGMLCDTGCGAYIPCKRRGVVCRTTCVEHKCTDACGCAHVSYSAETNCEELMRPVTIPWWFSPGKGNTYLDGEGNVLCGPGATVEEQPVVETPPAVETPPTVPAPPERPETPAVPETPEPPAEEEDMPEVVEINGNG